VDRSGMERYGYFLKNNKIIGVDRIGQERIGMDRNG